MNIFEIQQDLLSIFDELEENGGELTEELEQRLAVTQENFRNKVESYAEVIKSFGYDVKACDEEIKRLQALKKSKQSTIDRLSNIVCMAIDKFGDTTKTGGKFINLGTSKLSVRNSEKVIVDEEYSESIVKGFDDNLRALAMTGELESNALNDILGFKQNDVEGITANISLDIPLRDVCSGKVDEFVRSVFRYGHDFKLKTNISKTELKDNLKADPNAYPELAHLETSKSLIIK